MNPMSPIHFGNVYFKTGDSNWRQVTNSGLKFVDEKDVEKAIRSDLPSDGEEDSRNAASPSNALVLAGKSNAQTLFISTKEGFFDPKYRTALEPTGNRLKGGFNDLAVVLTHKDVGRLDFKAFEPDDEKAGRINQLLGGRDAILGVYDGTYPVTRISPTSWQAMLNLIKEDDAPKEQRFEEPIRQERPAESDVKELPAGRRARRRPVR